MAPCPLVPWRGATLALLRIEVNASLKTLASESTIRFMAALRRTTEAPPRPTKPAGQDSWALMGGPRFDDSTAPITDECQFFLDNVVAQFG
jgi:hypothetical protein